MCCTCRNLDGVKSEMTRESGGGKSQYWKEGVDIATLSHCHTVTLSHCHTLTLSERHTVKI